MKEASEEEIEKVLEEFANNVNKMTEDINDMFESFLRDENALAEFSKLLGEIPSIQRQQNGDETVT
jgi:uncharacterized protein YpuA (DUF1002 family)